MSTDDPRKPGFSLTRPADANKAAVWSGGLEITTTMGTYAVPYVLHVPWWTPVAVGHHGAVVDARVEELLADGMRFITGIADLFTPPPEGWIARLGPTAGDIITPAGELFTDGVIVTPIFAEQSRGMGNMIGVLFASRTDSRELRDAPPDFDTLPLLDKAMEQGNLLGTMVNVAWLNTDPVTDNHAGTNPEEQT